MLGVTVGAATQVIIQAVMLVQQQPHIGQLPPVGTPTGTARALKPPSKPGAAHNILRA